MSGQYIIEDMIVHDDEGRWQDLDLLRQRDLRSAVGSPQLPLWAIRYVAALRVYPSKPG